MTVSGASAAFSHTVTAPTTYYYRARARNKSGTCDKESGNSGVVAVVVSPASPETKYLVVVGSVAGGSGSYFKTSAQFHNWGADTLTGKMVFHPAGRSGSDSDPAMPYALGPRQTLSFEDLLATIGTTGVGSLDIVPSSGPVPHSVARIFNDWDSKGTAGMTLEAVTAAQALGTGKTGVLIAPIDPTRMRFNIGIRTVGTSGASITVRVYDRFGTLKKTFTSEFGPTYFQQTSAKELTGLDLQRDDVIAVLVNSGAILLYGSSTDNITQDPNFQMATPLP